MDNKVFNKSGYEAGQEEQFQYLLFGGGNLADGPHELKLTNASPGSNSSILDLDYVGVYFTTLLFLYINETISPKILFESQTSQHGKVDTTTLNASDFAFLPGISSWQVSSET